MENTLRSTIIKAIQKSDFSAFTISDFLRLGNYEAIKKTLQRLQKNKMIRRVIRGVYDRPEYNEKFKMFASPDVNEVALAIARQFNWNISPSGNYALNLLGLSTQVPAKFVYVSDGPYRKYMVEGIELEFRHSNKKEISNFSYMTLVVIQALKAHGQRNICQEDLERIKKNLTEDDMKLLLSEGNRTNIWIYEIIKKICGA